MLDKRIYRAMNIAPISNTIVIEKINTSMYNIRKEIGLKNMRTYNIM